ncbi:MAG TPA: hypothetical protein VMC81_10400 [Rhodocyclaceae bacterium]|nr:hypothetical protein [Rhodocyclaceae bacterium]
MDDERDILEKADKLMRRHRTFIAGSPAAAPTPDRADDLPMLTDVVTPEPASVSPVPPEPTGPALEERVRVLAEERAQVLAEDLALVMTEERAQVLAKDLAMVLAEERAQVLAEERAHTLAAQQAEVLARQRAPALAEERAQVLAQELMLERLSAQQRAVSDELSAWLDKELPRIVVKVLDGVSDQLIAEVTAEARTVLQEWLQLAVEAESESQPPRYAVRDD